MKYEWKPLFGFALFYKAGMFYYGHDFTLFWKIVRYGILAFILLVILGLIIQYRERRTPKSLAEIDSYAKVKNLRKRGDLFEFAVKRIFTLEGFKANTVGELKASGAVRTEGVDQGCDVVATLDGIVYAIQCKHTTPKGKIGNYAVQEVLASLAIYSAHKGIVITNGFYTPSAKELAKANNVILIDRNELKKLVA
jgi:restriction endonuclease Mrr